MKIKVEYPVTRFETKEVEIPDKYAEYFNNDLYVDFDMFPDEVMEDIEDCIYYQTAWDIESDYEILDWETNTSKEMR